MQKRGIVWHNVERVPQYEHDRGRAAVTTIHGLAWQATQWRKSIVVTAALPLSCLLGALHCCFTLLPRLARPLDDGVSSRIRSRSVYA